MLWAVYAALGLLGLLFLYQTFGWMIPSLPVSEASTETEVTDEIEGA